MKMLNQRATMVAFAVVTTAISSQALATVVVQGTVGVRSLDGQAYSFIAPSNTSQCAYRIIPPCGPGISAASGVTGTSNTFIMDERYDTPFNLSAASNGFSTYNSSTVDGLTYTNSFGAVSNVANKLAGSMSFVSPSMDSFSDIIRPEAGAVLAAGETRRFEVTNWFSFQTDESSAPSIFNSVYTNVIFADVVGFEGTFTTLNLTYSEYANIFTTPEGGTCNVTTGNGFKDVSCSTILSFTNNTDHDRAIYYSIETNVGVGALETVAGSGLGYVPVPPVFGVPEPSTYGMMGLGLLAVAAAARRRRLSKSSSVGGSAPNPPGYLKPDDVGLLARLNRR